MIRFHDVLIRVAQERKGKTMLFDEFLVTFNAIGADAKKFHRFWCNSDKWSSFGKMIFWVLCRQDLRPERWNGHFFFGQRSEVELVFLDLLC
jgi:hypothetical protein